VFSRVDKLYEGIKVVDLSNLDTEPVTAVDPNALLAKLREAAQQTMSDLDDPETAEEVPVNEAVLAETFLQLDDWVARGGFLPQPWQGDGE
jgi:hypothetical protein